MKNKNKDAEVLEYFDDEMIPRGKLKESEV